MKFKGVGPLHNCPHKCIVAFKIKSYYQGVEFMIYFTVDNWRHHLPSCVRFMGMPCIIVEGPTCKGKKSHKAFGFITKDHVLKIDTAVVAIIFLLHM